MFKWKCKSVLILQTKYNIHLWKAEELINQNNVKDADSYLKNIENNSKSGVLQINFFYLSEKSISHQHRLKH